MRCGIALPTGALLVACLALSASAQTMRSYDNDLASPPVLEDIDLSTGEGSLPPDYALCSPKDSEPLNALFGTGFVSGLAYRGTRLYGLAWSADAVSVAGRLVHPIELVEIRQKPLCAGSVSVGPIVDRDGHPLENLEGLAYSPRDDLFYSVDYDVAARRGQLVRIDPGRAVATPVDASHHLASELKVQGLTCCDSTGDFYALSSGFAGVSSPQLLKLGRTHGRATVIGPTMTGPSTPLQPMLESLELDRSASVPRLFAAGAGLYELDPTTGAATRVQGSESDAVWGIAMAVPEPVRLWQQLAALTALACCARAAGRPGARAS